jgi:hypothetical protein
MTVLPEPTPAEQALLEREGLDTLEGAFAYAGGERLDKAGLGRRQRLRLRLRDDEGREVTWYMKRYGRDPLGLRWARTVLGGPPRCPALRELACLADVAEAGVPTMRAVTAGAERDLFGIGRSYVIFAAVPGEALERCLPDRLPGWSDGQVEPFNEALADLAVGLHGAGLVHRDFYASHIYLSEGGDGPRLYLIDLARVFRPSRRRYRWTVKDLAALKYSMPEEWVKQHWRSFWTTYKRRRFVRNMLHGRSDAAWLASIEAKVRWMRRRHERKQAGGGSP